MHRVASKIRKEIKRKTKKKVERLYPKMAGICMVKKSKRQTEVEGSGGGLLPAVEGYSLGT